MRSAKVWLLVAFVFPAWAHETKNVLTTVEVNARTGQLEVIHRFVLHDVEHAIRQFDWGQTDVLANPHDRQRFSEYVQQQFGLLADGEPVALDLVGQELGGRYLWVYQEGREPAAMQSLTVVNTVLGKPPRHHLVNVRLANFVESVVFETGVSELTLYPAR